MNNKDKIDYLTRKIESIDRTNDRMRDKITNGGSKSYYSQKIISNNEIAQKAENEIAELTSHESI